ncbi:hypothetical protein [Mangrovibacterium lignilyticum]|uniref:hypothetical protein n=1 Tax=Mangrovibacterium lignilyticum TaxID=2668052 RepID=UPI0013D32D20|nr:hypothetical protein [Mangrovibacterium lignilyticum]
MKKLFVFILLTVFSLGSFAQPQKDKQKDWEQYKAKRVSFMTEKMQLTPDEAQKFWPLYNEFDKARWDCHERRRDLEREVKDKYDSISDADFKKMNQEIVNLYLKEAQLVKTYNDQFLKVLPVKKVILVGPTENEFRFKMIREFRQKERDDDNK